MMRPLLLLPCLFLAAEAAGQAAAPSYQPDTLSPLGHCDTLRVLPYFFVGGKYPLSSEALARRADSALHTRDAAANGYLSFQLLIGCDGKIRRHRLLQSDAEYRPVQFRPEIPAELFQFVSGLAAWPLAQYERKPVNYRVYLSFKLVDGHVAAVSP